MKLQGVIKSATSVGRRGKSGKLSDVDLVASSSLFDEVNYAAAAGISGSRTELAEHFCTTGHRSGLNPSGAFDCAFYLQTNFDVRDAGANPFVHYLRHGAGEARYPNRDKLREDAAELEQNDVFNSGFYVASHGITTFPPAQDYLLGWRNGRRPSDWFDDVFFEETYAATARTGRPPVFDFIDRRTADVLFTRRDVLETVIAQSEGAFDAEYYRTQFDPAQRGLLAEPRSCHLHYLTRGVNEGLRPSRGFSPNFYREANPDLAGWDIEPFTHYTLHGKLEGRVPDLLLQNFFRFGGVEYRPELGTLLIANHDSSRTGAPLVGLNLARELGERWNVFTFVGRAEALIEEFEEHSCGLVVGWRNEAEQAGLIAELVRLYGLQCVVVNSVEASGLVSAAVRGGVGVVALIHEFADYTAPFGRTTDAVRLADRVIVPADLVAQSLQAEIEAVCGGRAPNIVVRRQGALPWLPGAEEDGPEPSTGMSADDIRSYVTERSGGPRRIVLGAGYVGQRKGVDLFVQTAAEVARVRDDVAFVWVGDGYAPRTDMAYSIWIDQMVRRMGLEHMVHFLPGQPSLDASFEVSDAFYLPSRLDPFPNVVIDALHASLGVVCFEGATGCAELFGPEEGLVGAAVAHCDVAAAARALLALLDDPGRAAGNAAAAVRSFAFADYVADIEREIAHARASAAQREAAAQRILASGTLNTAFYQGRPGGNALAAVRDYVASSRHGLARRNPCPGFNDNLWQARAGHQPGRAALDEALEAGGGTMIPTHVCHRLGRGGARAVRAIRDEQPRTGLHIHFHYSELATDFARRLDASGMKVDVIATVTSEHGRRETEYAFRDYAGGSVETVEVPNRGRDVGPLLVDLAGRFEGYDIVGHLHAKRSLVIGQAAGDAWREFLLDTLLGDDNGVLAEILTLFARDANLGLVFPEDPHNVGWSRNRSYGEELAARMTPRPAITERPVFPIGTMFWARRAVIEPFWNLHLTRQDLPTEPLPYDGSILHAVERLIPDTCKAVGLDWNTIHLNATRR